MNTTLFLRLVLVIQPPNVECMKNNQCNCIYYKVLTSQQLQIIYISEQKKIMPNKQRTIVLLIVIYVLHQEIIHFLLSSPDLAALDNEQEVSC